MATEKLWEKEMPATRGSLRLLSHLSSHNEIDWRKVRVIQIILKCTVCGNPVQVLDHMGLLGMYEYTL